MRDNATLIVTGCPRCAEHGVDSQLVYADDSLTEATCFNCRMFYTGESLALALRDFIARRRRWAGRVTPCE